MTFTAAQIALLASGKIEGDPKTVVTNFGKIEEATPSQLTFFSNPKYEEFLYSTKASIIIINEDFVLKQPVQATLILVKDAYTAFAALLTKYQELMAAQLTGIQQPSFIDSTAQVDSTVFIGAFAYVGKNAVIGKQSKIHAGCYIGDHVKIGEGCVLHPGVTIYHHCELQNNIVIHAGTIVGSDGFGFAPLQDGSYMKIPQIGNVRIEDNVEIGANTTIDRATIGSTIIRKGSKLDNLIQIAHNVDIGDSTVIAAQTGISGSTKIGKRVMIGGQAGIAGHLNIADEVKINAQSGISKSYKKGEKVSGTPANSFAEYMRSQAVLRRLPDLENRIIELEKQLEEIRKTTS